MNAKSGSMIASGAGVGMIVGWWLDNIASGLVFGAAAGLVLDVLLRRVSDNDSDDSS